MKPSIQEASAASRLIYAALKPKAVGESVTYVELSSVVRFDVQRNRGSLATARRMLLREGIVFGIIQGVGLKRLDAAGVAAEVSRGLKSVHRGANRTMRKAETVADPMSMPVSERTRFFATTSCLAAVAHATRETTVRKLAITVEKTQARLPLDETIAAFK